MPLRTDSISRLSKAYYLAFFVILALVAFGYWRAHQLVQEGRGTADHIAKIAELNRLAYEIAADIGERHLDLLVDSSASAQREETEVAQHLDDMYREIVALRSSRIVQRANQAVPPDERADFIVAAAHASALRAHWNHDKASTRETPTSASASFRAIQREINKLNQVLEQASRNLARYSDANRSFIRANAITISILIGIVLLLQALLVHRRLTQSLRRSVESLQSQRSEIADQNRKLIALGADLEKQNQELQIHQTELAQALYEQQVSNELLTVASMRFQQLFHSTPVACFSCDLEGNVYEWNEAAESLFGYEAFRMFEQNAVDLLTVEASRPLLSQLILKAAGTQTSATDEMTLRDRAERQLRVQVSVVPVRGGQGQITGVIAACVDLTEIRRVQEQVRLLSVVAETTINGIMVTDPQERIVYCNPALEGMFGFSMDEMRGKKPKEFLQGPGTDAESRSQLRNAIQNQQSVKTEIVNYRRDGTPITVELSLTPVFSESGEILNFAAVESDISERKQAELRLRQRDEQFSVIMSAIQSGVMLYGADGQLSLVNGYALSALDLKMTAKGYALPDGCKLTNLDGKPITSDLNHFDPKAKRRLGQIVVLHQPDRPDVILSVDTLPITDSQSGATLGGLRAFTNVTSTYQMQRQLESHLLEIAEFNLQLELQTGELESLNSKLEALATTDGLTGLTNHRAFRERLESEIKRSTQTGKPFSLVLLDVDHFKAFNDTFGHQAGDEVLKGVAEQLLSVARDSDLVARYGGEEFVLLLPKADGKGANIAVERFRKALDHHQWPYRHVTASFGVATFQSGLQANELIEQADKALYASKHAGRNRSTHYGELDDRIITAA